jgi:ribonucleoside-diphosphate reductase alpha chain
MTKNPEVRFAKSIVDYIFRWMATKFLSPEAQFRVGVNMAEPTGAGEANGVAKAGASAKAAVAADLQVRPEAPPIASHASDVGKRATEFSHAAIQNQEDAPPCSTCGSIMIRSGSCYKCANCGTTSGCA